MHLGQLSTVGRAHPVAAPGGRADAGRAREARGALRAPPCVASSLLVLAALLLVTVGGCTSETPSPPVPTPRIVIPTLLPTPLSPARQLLATLPIEAGGKVFDEYQIIDDSWNVGHPIDEVLAALGKERKDAVLVFRYADDLTMGAVAVDGIGGPKLLDVFVETWNAPAVIRRSPRPVGTLTGWRLDERGGARTVVYLRADVIYLVFTLDPDPLKLNAILADMPSDGE
jgi:hypothetical protein